LHYCEIGKAGSRRERRKKMKRRRETGNKQGLLFGLCFHFSAYKICKTGKKKVQKTSREREGRRLQRRNSKEECQQRIGGKS
jgi:hypothetical protein